MRDQNLHPTQFDKKEDLLAYFAMSLFEKRKPYIQHPENLKRDIKVLFGEYKTALNLAKELLFAIADVELIEQQCIMVILKPMKSL